MPCYRERQLLVLITRHATMPHHVDRRSARRAQGKPAVTRFVRSDSVCYNVAMILSPLSPLISALPSHYSSLFLGPSHRQSDRRAAMLMSCLVRRLCCSLGSGSCCFCCFCFWIGCCFCRCRCFCCSCGPCRFCFRRRAGSILFLGASSRRRTRH